MEMSNLHWKIIHTKGEKGKSEDSSASDAIRGLNPAVSVMAMTETLTWCNAMDLVRGNNCAVDTSDNPFTR